MCGQDTHLSQAHMETTPRHLDEKRPRQAMTPGVSLAPLTVPGAEGVLDNLTEQYLCRVPMCGQGVTIKDKELFWLSQDRVLSRGPQRQQ